MRERYTWHLRPPFKDEFDLSHWWNNEQQIKPVAALYELARRHPLVGEPRLRVRDTSWYKAQTCDRPLSGPVLRQALVDLKQKSEALRCLCLIGSKPWPLLSEKDQRLWSSAARKMKGVDCRSVRESCYRLPSSNLEIAMWPSDPPTHGLQILDDCIAPGPQGKRLRFSDDPLEAEIARHAIGAHRQGYILIAVASDLTAEKAAPALVETYREHPDLYPQGKSGQRAYWKKWLLRILAFENAETNRAQKAKSQVFNLYRIALEGLFFQ